MPLLTQNTSVQIFPKSMMRRRGLTDLNLLHRPEKALHKGVGGHELTLFLDQLFQILVHARNINHNLPKMQNLEA